MLTIDSGSNKSLYTLIAVVIFGIFLALSYWMFGDQMKGVLGSVTNGVSEVTGVKISNTLAGPVVTPQPTPNPDGDFVFNASLGMIQDYRGLSKDVVIPSTIGGVPVTSIGTNAFYGDNLTSVYFPNSIVSLGINSFRDNNLKTLTLPEGLIKIDEYAFASNSLTSITLPESLKVINFAAFFSNSLTHVYIPKGVTTLPGSVFRYNSSLTSASISNGTTYKTSSPETFQIGTVVTRY